MLTLLHRPARGSERAEVTRASDWLSFWNNSSTWPCGQAGTRVRGTGEQTVPPTVRSPLDNVRVCRHPGDGDPHRDDLETAGVCVFADGAPTLRTATVGLSTIREVGAVRTRVARDVALVGIGHRCYRRRPSESATAFAPETRAADHDIGNPFRRTAATRRTIELATPGSPGRPALARALVHQRS